jgi:hypothetical protein
MLIYWRLGSILTTTHYNTTTPDDLQSAGRETDTSPLDLWPWHCSRSLAENPVALAEIFGYQTIPWIVSIFPISRKIGYTIIYHGIPIGSMYGIYANIGGILMVNVTIYGIHGSYG